MKKCVVIVSMVPLMAFAQQSNRDSFLRQQAFDEMQRVSSQVDVLQTNFSDLQRRVSRLEGGGDTQGMRQEIDALKATVADLKRQLANQRKEIVSDLSSRISKMPVAKPAEPKQVVIGPHTEYIVQSGDTLSLISQAFNTPVKKIREMNSLKSDNLRIGQKLMLPKQ